jgi:hypothetical protein
VQIARRDDTGADVWKVEKYVDGHDVIELGEAATLERARAIAETVNTLTPFALAGLLIGGGYHRDCISRASIQEAFERLAIAALDSAEFRAGAGGDVEDIKRGDILAILRALITAYDDTAMVCECAREVEREDA